MRGSFNPIPTVKKVCFCCCWNMRLRFIKIWGDPWKQSLPKSKAWSREVIKKKRAQTLVIAVAFYMQRCTRCWTHEVFLHFGFGGFLFHWNVLRQGKGWRASDSLASKKMAHENWCPYFIADPPAISMSHPLMRHDDLTNDLDAFKPHQDCMKLLKRGIPPSPLPMRASSVL